MKITTFFVLLNENSNSLRFSFQGTDDKREFRMFSDNVTYGGVVCERMQGRYGQRVLT